MANFKTRSDDQIWWESQPGNRGKTYPGDSIASKQYDRNKAAGENNASMLRSFLFGSSDARKRSVEDAVNSRRDSGKEIPIQPFKYPPSKLFPNDLSSNDEELIAQTTRAKRGGKISLKDCKVSTHGKNSKHKKSW